MAATGQRLEADAFRRLLVWVSLIGTSIFLYRYNALLHAGQAILAEDFSVFYRAAQQLAMGNPVAVYGGSEGTIHPFVNPPFFLLALKPLAYFNPSSALWLYYGVQIAAWVAAWHVRPVKALFPQLSHRPAAYSFTISAISLPFAVHTVLAGQTGLLSATLLLLGIAFWQSKPPITGIFWGLLTYKFQLALLPFIALLACRQYKAIAAFTVTVLLLCLGATMQFGADIWLHYLEASRLHAQTVLLTIPEKYQQQLISLYAALRQLGFSLQLASLMQLVLAMGTITATVLVLRRAPISLAAAFLCIALYFCSAYVLAYDTVIISIALLLLIEQYYTKALPATLRAGIIAALFIGLVSPSLQHYGIPFAITILLWLATDIFKWSKRA